MPNIKNKDSVKDIREKVAKAKAIVVADYHGLKVNQINDLRSRLSEQGMEMAVTKNTLLKIALKEENVTLGDFESHLKGPSATFFAYEDAIAPLKVLFEFNKEYELPVIKAGIIEGTYNDSEGVKVLSELPGKDELIARVVGGMKSPLVGLVNVLGGNQRNLVYVLSAIANKKEVS